MSSTGAMRVMRVLEPRRPEQPALEDVAVERDRVPAEDGQQDAAREEREHDGPDACRPAGRRASASRRRLLGGRDGRGPACPDVRRAALPGGVRGVRRVSGRGAASPPDHQLADARRGARAVVHDAHDAPLVQHRDAVATGR